jgi:hypothetical protein
MHRFGSWSETAASHWRAVELGCVRAHLERVAALPEQDRAGWLDADHLALDAHRLFAERQFPDAIVTWRQVLPRGERLFGVDSIAVAEILRVDGRVPYTETVSRTTQAIYRRSASSVS